jgi:hypothetical protein
VEVEVSDIAFELQGRVYHAILSTLPILNPNNNIQITTCLKSKRWSMVCRRVIQSVYYLTPSPTRQERTQSVQDYPVSLLTSARTS